jgi:acid phosphatase type 7
MRGIFLQIVVLGIALVVGLAAALVITSLGQPAPAASGPPATARRSVVPPPTPSPTDTGVAVLVGAGDIASCEWQEDELTADLVERTPGIVFTLGDHIYPNASLTDFDSCYAPSWGRPSIKERTRPAPGGNEYDVASAEGYFSYFGEAAGDPATGYYAYDAGEWRVYVLNSECRLIGGCGVGSAQHTWLLGDLAANPRECVVAMWHDPRFTSSLDGGSDSMREIWRVLYEAGAELVLSGDHHFYERFEPQTAGGEPDPARGIVQFIVGTGGADAEDFESEAPNSLVRAARVFGVLRLELAPTSYSFEFLQVAGRQFSDSGSAECH